MALPDKLRADVADAGDDGDRLDARRAVLATLLSELAFKAKLTVSTGVEWADLKRVVDTRAMNTAAVADGHFNSSRALAAAVARYIDAKITPLGERDAEAYRENAQLGEAVTLAVQLTSELDHWTSGMAALAEKQSALPAELLRVGAEGSALIAQMKWLINSDEREFMAASGAFEAAHMHGLGALLWIRPSIVEIDLSNCILPSAECATLIKMCMPRRFPLNSEPSRFASPAAKVPSSILCVEQAAVAHHKAPPRRHRLLPTRQGPPPT